MTDKQGERLALSIIRDLYERGEFEACVARCDRYATKDSAEATEVALLQARCLISLERGAQAIEALRRVQAPARHIDQEITGRMLTAAAYLNLGQVERGFETVRAAYDARSEAHPVVQAEITVYLAIAHCIKGEYQRADRLLQTVPNDADIVSAHALLYRGYVAWARGDYAGSVDRFRDGLRRIDACKRHDRFVEAKCIHALAYLAGELPLLHLWPEVSERVRQFDWSVSGVAIWRYWIALEGSFVSELLGDLNASTAWAELADEIAPDPACRIIAWCRMAARFGRNGETGAHAWLVDKALRRYNEIASVDSRVANQRGLSLDLAEEILYGPNPGDAAPLITYFGEAIGPAMRGHGDDRRHLANFAMCQGLLDEQRGNRARAKEAYERALQAFKDAGLLRRAAIIAHRLLVLTGDPEHERFIAEALRDASKAYWLKANLTKSRSESRLSPRQLLVLPMIAQGMTNEEIAAVRGGSKYTVRNMVRDMIRLLGVHNRAELVSVAAQRGLLQPAN